MSTLFDVQVELIEIEEMVDLLPIRLGMGPQNADRLKARLNTIRALLTPEQATPQDLGLRADLDISRPVLFPHEFRCGRCDEIQPVGAWQVWVKRNGSVGAWCVECARKLPPLRRK